MESIPGSQTTPIEVATNRANTQNLTPVTLLTGKIGSSKFLPHINFQVDPDNKYNTYTTGKYDNYSKTFSINFKDLWTDKEIMLNYIIEFYILMGCSLI